MSPFFSLTLTESSWSRDDLCSHASVSDLSLSLDLSSFSGELPSMLMRSRIKSEGEKPGGR